ncbi:MAG: hypothetical protein Ct9H300mP16_13870 [Pseudomonadota bacterium]|nr:MAG: hypothetical protein Ct9H300mP16_13870 [Pseudomonadota bacterium]
MCIGGINNWDRVRLLKEQWQRGKVERLPGEVWGAALGPLCAANSRVLYVTASWYCIRRLTAALTTRWCRR